MKKLEKLGLAMSAAALTGSLCTVTAFASDGGSKGTGAMGYSSLIFLILMFSLESKIIFLVLWIISIIAIALFLIIVEFIHSKLEEQQQLVGMTFDEMLETFRRKEN